MDVNERMALIKRHTQEIVEEAELKKLFESGKPHAYIGFACTGRLHTGYMIPIRKIVDFLNAGVEFTFLIADLHAYLDDKKTLWELLSARFDYYKAAITGVLKAFNAPLDKVRFVRGSDFELDGNYFKNVLHMAGDVTQARVKRASSEVVRFGDEPKLGGFIYPLMQIEDVYALGCNIAFGGIDQRGIYMLGRDLAPRMGRDKYVCVFTPLLPGLSGGKMSASDETSKIDLLDDADTVKKKLNKAHCPAASKDDNGVLAFVEYVLMPFLKDSGRKFLVERPEKFGGNAEFSDFQELDRAYMSGKLHPADLKQGVARELTALLGVVQKEVSSGVLKAAFP